MNPFPFQSHKNPSVAGRDLLLLAAETCRAGRSVPRSKVCPRQNRHFVRERIGRRLLEYMVPSPWMRQ